MSWGAWFGPTDWYVRWRGRGHGISVQVVGDDYTPIFSERQGYRSAWYIPIGKSRRLRLEHLRPTSEGGLRP